MPFRSWYRHRVRRVLGAAMTVFVLLGPGARAMAAPEVSTVGNTGASGMDGMPGMPMPEPGTGNEHGDQNTADQDTPYGPLSQYDRNLIIHVRWANLWEGPVSARVATRSADPKVRAVAAQLAVEHHELEGVVAETAARLNLPLPDTPTPLQQEWVNEILSKTGPASDDTYSNLTRAGHGTIFMLISQVRAQTRNDVVRDFAQKANDTVMRHMTLLESTGLVRSSSLVVGSLDPAPYQVFPSRD